MNPTPLGINTVFVCPNIKIRNVLIQAIAAAGDLKPALKSDSVSARRAHYAPALAKCIINTASPDMQTLLGDHSVALAIEVSDRVAAAIIAKKVFNDAGFGATLHTHAEPEFPEGFLTFLDVPALQGIVLMFWPRSQDVTSEMLTQLPQREPWTEADFNAS